MSFQRRSFELRTIRQFRCSGMGFMSPACGEALGNEASVHFWGDAIITRFGVTCGLTDGFGSNSFAIAMVLALIVSVLFPTPHRRLNDEVFVHPSL
eukprot:1176431-Prorocentrum_minimum.AAC.6